ncbi:MAG: hypothetical protein J6D47_19450 [Peptostreptococcaceae bacterium]|nr:hypothetical protein [Peptostreptococcaceae bacterium]
MNSFRKATSVITSFIIFSLILLPNNIYSMQKNEKTPKEVVIGGQLLEIEMKTNNVVVYGIELNNKLKNYDRIESISGEIIRKVYNKNKVDINNRSELINILLNMNDDDKITVDLIRDNRNIYVELTKSELNHSYLIEKIPYSATLTYIDENNQRFGAVAHSLENKETKNVLNNKGEIYLANLNHLQQSKKKCVGNVSGEKIYDKQGEVSKFSDYGVHGSICSTEILKNKKIYKVAEPNEVKKGRAYLVINHIYNEEKAFYEIEITKVNKQHKKDDNSFEFTLKDDELIKEYGGIVQGMSGAPIIQDNKLIGALSHVKTDNTINGVGLYIKWMMED